MGVDILGVDVLGVDVLKLDITALHHLDILVRFVRTKFCHQVEGSNERLGSRIFAVSVV